MPSVRAKSLPDPNGMMPSRGRRASPILHEAVHDLMNHTIATKREHRVKAGGRARHLRGDARTGREAHVKTIRRRPVGGKRATHELGSLGARAALRGGVGDDERMSKVKRHAASLPRRP